MDTKVLHQTSALARIADAEVVRLEESLRSYADVLDGEFDKLLRLVHAKLIDKGAFLVRAGETRSCLDFMVSGVIRCYGIDESGAEYTKHFFTEGDFIVTDRRFLFGDAEALEVAEYYFEALEETRILTVAAGEFGSQLVHPCWHKVFLSGIARLQELEQRRIGQLLTADARTRYRQFLEYPGLDKRIQRHPYRLLSERNIFYPLQNVGPNIGPVDHRRFQTAWQGATNDSR